MSKYLNRRIIRAKVESVYNTDAAPANGDSVLVSGFSWSLADLKIAPREVSAGSKMPMAGVFAGTLVEITFAAELKGSGTAGTPPDIGPLLQCCGMKVTNVPATSDTYKNDSADEKSATIWFKDGGDEDEWRLTGCRGAVTFDVMAGDFGKANFTIRGHLTTAYPQATAAWAPTYDATEPVPVLNKPLVIGGVTVEQSKIAIDCGNAIVTPVVLNQADGFGEVRISKREPKLTATISAPAVATMSPIADLKANTTKTLSQAVIGTTAGNRYQFTFAGGAKYIAVPDGEADGLVTYDVVLQLIETVAGADNELSLIFT